MAAGHKLVFLTNFRRAVRNFFHANLGFCPNLGWGELAQSQVFYVKISVFGVPSNQGEGGREGGGGGSNRLRQKSLHRKNSDSSQ